MPSIVRCTMFLLLVAQYPVSGYAQNSPATCEPTSWVPPGFQAILLGAPFQQYGSITAINASMAFSVPSFAHAIYLQVWRPVNQSTFALVGQQYFFADPSVTQLTSTTLMFPAQFRNSPSIQLSFIPNDVLGYYVIMDGALDQLGYAYSLSPILGNSSRPLSIDVYTSNSSVPLQSISISGSPTYPSVHPYITIAYVTSSPSPSVGGVQRSTITVLGACPMSSSILTPTNTPKPSPSSLVYNSIFPSTTSLDATSPPLPLTSSLPSTPTISTSPLPPSTTTLPTSSSPFIIVGAVAGAVCLLLCVGIVGTVAFIIRSRQRTTKMASGLLKAKPDDPDINGEIVHYESKHGVLYALPDKQKDGVPRPCYNENNIESYASSYEVNGQVHMYQEAGETLNMTSPVYQQIPADVDHASPPHHHPGPIAADLMSSSHSIPLASPSRTPCTPYSDPKVTAPPTFIPPRSRTLSTHTSKPSVPQNPIATLTRPLPPRPPSLSTHNSPPAWDEQQKPSMGVNRLFIELDEQGFHVPSSLERQSFTNSSHQDIYSRLAHPKATNRNSHDSNFFEQNEMFWDPPSSTKELYDVLSRRKYREIHRNDLSVVSTLGSGNFGTVCKGVWTFPGGHIEVAMKTLKDGASEEDKVKFLQEAAIMGQFSHPNVVKLYGVVTVGDPLLLVLELIPNGDLRKFVMQYRRKKSTRHPSTILIPASLPKTFIAFAKDIACGMTYLSRKNYVHRDLAARNIFLTEDLRCKIGDFGMARDLAQSYAGIYQSQGGMIPLKWSAPEAIEHHQYITASDVWSFGMVLYEVWSLGHKPFGKVSPEKLANLVTSGYCQPPPPGCPRTIYGLMVQCWNPKAAKRPTFSELYRQLGRPVEELLEWCEEDRQCGELVTELGAPMACSRNLYPDLQNTYSASTYV